MGDSDLTVFAHDIPWGRTIMSIDMPAVLENGAATSTAAYEPVKSAWIETALTALLTAAAVLFVSFIAVVTGLV
jgi:hypothetical protein